MTQISVPTRRARGKPWAVALAVSLFAALAGSSPAAAAPSYVALGDSYTAGPLIPQWIAPLGCLKSNHNYPHLAAPSLGQPEFRDASCSGAETDHMTEPQDVWPVPNPPQFDRLDAETAIVTVGIGGNDIGFSDIVENCLSFIPFGHPCMDKYVDGEYDEISERIAQTAPKIAATLAGIHERSPNAEVFVVNYLPIFPETGVGCWPQLPVAWGDVPYLRAKEQELNQMLADEAAAGDATVVDAYTAGIGHDACKGRNVRWVEPLIPGNPAAPLHPNLNGMTGTADAVVDAAG